MTPDADREVRVALLNGTIIGLTLPEMRRLIYGRHVMVLMLGFLLAITVSTPTLFPTLPEYRSRLFYWGLSILLYLSLLPSWSALASDRWQTWFGRPLPLVVATVPLVVGLTVLATQLPTIFGPLVPPRGHAITWVTFVKNCLIAQMIETAALVWLLPLQRGQDAHRRSPIAPADPPPRQIVLNGRSVPLPSVSKVRSAEHYLILDSDHGTTEMRARMKDFVVQVGDDDGIQTHRSFWVSTAEALRMDGAVVRTRSGEDIPVSRGRMNEVRDWFRRHGKPF